MEGEAVVAFGKAPWQIVKADVMHSLPGSSPIKIATVLDANGMKVKEIPLEARGARKQFRFPPDALYAVLRP